MKIAENVMVYVKDHFKKMRPFEIVNGYMSKFCTFPTKIRIRKKTPGSSAWDRDTELKIYESTYINSIEEPINQPLILKGNSFRIGIYFGDIYSAEGKPYYLYDIISEPTKRLFVNVQSIGQHMELFIESPGGWYASKIPVKREGTFEGDMENISKKITSLKGCFSDLVDDTEKDLEVYIRKYYLINKVSKVGGGKFKNLF